MRMNADEFVVATFHRKSAASSAAAARNGAGQEQSDDERLSYLRVAAESSLDAIIGTGADGRIVLWNGGAERCFGYTSHDVAGRPIAALAPAAEAGEIAAMMRQVGAGGRITRYETTWLRKDGCRVGVEVTATPVYGDGGDYRGAAIVARDVSERRRFDEDLLHAEKLESLGQLAGGMAHDFNNLATAIIGYADLGMAELPPHARACDDFMHVRDTAERAASLAQRLLAYSRKRPMRPADINVSRAVRSAEDLFRTVLGERVHLAMQLSRDGGRARIDPGELEQVILNLVLNARDALPGGGRITVETGTVVLERALKLDRETVLAAGAYVTLTVTDDGTGMTPDVQRRVFEPFFTTKRDGGGTGLGLANCRRIARRVGGGISVHSEPGYGSMFRVFMPRVQDEAGAPSMER